jgi:hypothetical protein
LYRFAVPILSASLDNPLDSDEVTASLASIINGEEPAITMGEKDKLELLEVTDSSKGLIRDSIELYEAKIMRL